jgi:hypothetical protein
MRVEKINGATERRILTAMVVKTAVLGRIAEKWSGKMFRSKWADIIGKWCVDYYREYKKAPGTAIDGLFTSWSSENQNRPDLIQIIEKFLSDLSSEHDRAPKINTQYVIDLAGDHFTKVKLERVLVEVQGELDRGRIKAASSVWSKFQTVSLGKGEGINVFTDQEAVRSALEEPLEPLFKYPGALGRLLNSQLVPDSFIAFFAPEKRGKTFWLMDFAIEGVKQGCNVAFFSAGDLTQNQMLRRLIQRWSGRPIKKGKTYLYPKKIFQDADGNIDVIHEVRKTDTVLSWQTAWKSLNEDFLKTKVKGGGAKKSNRFKLSTYSNSTLSMEMIHSQLDQWKREEDWVPHVVIIDYIDILLMEGPDERSQIDATWKRGRRLSQDWHCLLIGASQTNAAGGEAEVLTRSNFSGDKRKLAHTTGILGINEKKGDKKKGIQRLNWIVLREDDYQTEDTVAVAGCRSIGRPWIKIFDKRIEEAAVSQNKKTKNNS